MAIFLLLIETLIFTLGFVYIFKRDRFFGVFYLLLFVYAIFAQIGYFYFSELSIFLGAYFGEEPWYKATLFILLSSASFLVLFIFFRRKFINLIPVSLVVTRRKNNDLGWIAAAFLIGVIVFELYYFVNNFNDISWFTAQDENFVSERSFLGLFIFFVKLMVAINLVLYSLVRGNIGVFPKTFLKSLFIVSLLTFLVISFRLGNRTDVLALTLGITVFEIYQLQFNWRVIAKLILFLGIMWGFLSIISSVRDLGRGPQLDFVSGILSKDYFAPAHILFAAVSLSYIDPLEVLVSNLTNSLVLFGHPYLQFTVMQMFQPGLASRSASYAFYVFTEGYLVMGVFGFLYNALVLMTGLSIWRRFALSNSKSFNLFLLGLMGCMLTNLVRGQSSYFVKYFYMFVIPGILLYLPLAGRKVSISIGARANLRRNPPDRDP